MNLMVEDQQEPQSAEGDHALRLGRLHFQEIRMADVVYIVDPGGYVGESTGHEISYAESLGKPVRYLSIGRQT